MAEIGFKIPTGTPAINSDEATKTVVSNEAVNDTVEYTYKRSITVRALTNYSAYRNANIQTLGRRRSNIGSSYNSTNILSSNKGEVEAYYPALIGLSANNPDFISRVKDYLSNIQVPVDDTVTFNNSIVFKNKYYYEQFKKQEDSINNAYENADKRDIKSLKEAIQNRINALNQLESTVYLTGRPEKVEDYIIYRHILLYKDVAKDVNVVNYERNFRFILVDEAREKNKQEKKMLATKKAMAAFVALGNNDEKFEAVFIRYCALNRYPVSSYLQKDTIEKNILLQQFVTEDPIKFNEICTDSNLLMIAFIERLIARGELVRSEHNQQISTSDGIFIGKNMSDAVAYFNNPDNAKVKDMFEAKLKAISY